MQSTLSRAKPGQGCRAPPGSWLVVTHPKQSEKQLRRIPFSSRWLLWWRPEVRMVHGEAAALPCGFFSLRGGSSRAVGFCRDSVMEYRLDPVLPPPVSAILPLPSVGPRCGRVGRLGVAQYRCHRKISFYSQTRHFNRLLLSIKVFP